MTVQQVSTSYVRVNQLIEGAQITYSLDNVVNTVTACINRIGVPRLCLDILSDDITWAIPQTLIYTSARSSMIIDDCFTITIVIALNGYVIHDLNMIGDKRVDVLPNIR